MCNSNAEKDLQYVIVTSKRNDDKKRVSNSSELRTKLEIIRVWHVRNVVVQLCVHYGGVIAGMLL